MNRRQLVFAAACVAQLAVPLSLVAKHEATRSGGTPWRFQAAPVDPDDPFRGKYVRLRFAAEGDAVPYADADPHPRGAGARAYAELAPGADGFARLTRLHGRRPASGDYVDVFVLGADEAGARVRLPFDRYYLPEERAPEVERQYVEALRTARDTTYAEVRVRDGHAALVRLVLDGRPVP